jgi:hypothetical protein
MKFVYAYINIHVLVILCQVLDMYLDFLLEVFL